MNNAHFEIYSLTCMGLLDSFSQIFIVVCCAQLVIFIIFGSEVERKTIVRFFTCCLILKIVLLSLFCFFYFYYNEVCFLLNYINQNHYFSDYPKILIIFLYGLLLSSVNSHAIVNYFLQDYQFSCDGVSFVFICLNALICYLCILYNSLNLKIKNFYFNTLCIVFIEFFMYFVFLTREFIVFYIFFEAILIPMFFMIGLFGSRNRKIHASYLFFVYTFIGSLLLLTALFFMYYKFGTTNIDVIYGLLSKDTIMLTFSEELFLWLLLFFGFAVKIPMFPVHIWLPEAHVEAPTAGSVILAGLLLKLGGYGVLRFLIPICGNINFLLKDFIILFCFLAIIYSSIAAIRQTDVKKIIAYSSVVHMNFGFIGIFLQNIDGAVSFVAIMLSHGIVSAGLFFIAGCIYERIGSRSMFYLRGLCQLMPIFSVLFFLLTLSNMSFPGTLSFAAEFLIIVSIFNEFKIISSIAILILSGSILYNIWVVTKTLFSVIDWETVKFLKFHDLSFREFKILFILIILSVIFGTLLCNPLIEFLKLTAFLYL